MADMPPNTYIAGNVSYTAFGRMKDLRIFFALLAIVDLQHSGDVQDIAECDVHRKFFCVWVGLESRYNGSDKS